jgi:hypothetical protein
MPAVAVVSIALGAAVALALVSAVAVIAGQLLRTSAVLADVDGLLAAVPPSLADMEPTLTRINRVLRSLALQ